MKTIKKIIRQVLSRLFVIDSLIIFKMNRPTSISSPAIIKKADMGNLTDILYFQDEKYVPIFEGFLEKGDIGYFGYIDGVCIHRSWAIINEGSIYNPHALVKNRLEKNEVYIHYCETAPIARGKNVYPLVISEVAKEFLDKDVLICVNKKNIPSIKGVNKAGFKPKHMIKVFSILGLVLKWKKNLKGVED
ncbi:hypothetical protein I2483_12860 [Sporosarcina sp. E16_3]|uniref:hypothetical protein n=1 Tax=Sporosarcina sp. E16_3 TaxID=2789293 RepID=UPI001A92BE8B|nr:hypothetical protein [Sporosarcina sp. E16_3]MBO0602550.1 hypothetical protein [Sporosarcina sp. E16_3]